MNLIRNRNAGLWKLKWKCTESFICLIPSCYNLRIQIANFEVKVFYSNIFLLIPTILNSLSIWKYSDSINCGITSTESINILIS